MADTYWLKQTKPLFSELEWNKPERRDQAGRLLIAGGNTHNFSAPAKAYEYAKTAGIGTAKVVLPDKTKRLIGQIMPEALFAPSTTSGEFATETLGSLLEYAQWSDTVLLPGNFGRNSQTSILLEDLLRAFTGRVVLACDAVDAVSHVADMLLSRPNTTLILSFAQLQKLFRISQKAHPITYGMDLVKLVHILHNLTSSCPAVLMCVHQNQIITAAQGKVSTTKFIQGEEPKIWRIEAAAYAACFQTWNPSKPFESLTHAASLI